MPTEINVFDSLLLNRNEHLLQEAHWCPGKKGSKHLTRTLLSNKIFLFCSLSIPWTISFHLLSETPPPPGTHHSPTSPNYLQLCTHAGPSCLHENGGIRILFHSDSCLSFMPQFLLWSPVFPKHSPSCAIPGALVNNTGEHEEEC